MADPSVAADLTWATAIKAAFVFMLGLLSWDIKKTKDKVNEMPKEYVLKEDMQVIEERLSGRIDKLGDQFDSGINRIYDKIEGGK